MEKFENHNVLNTYELMFLFLFYFLFIVCFFFLFCFSVQHQRIEFWLNLPYHNIYFFKFSIYRTYSSYFRYCTHTEQRITTKTALYSFYNDIRIGCWSEIRWILREHYLLDNVLIENAVRSCLSSLRGIPVDLIFRRLLTLL